MNSVPITGGGSGQQLPPTGGSADFTSGINKLQQQQPLTSYAAPSSQEGKARRRYAADVVSETRNSEAKIVAS